MMTVNGVPMVPMGNMLSLHGDSHDQAGDEPRRSLPLGGDHDPALQRPCFETSWRRAQAQEVELVRAGAPEEAV